MPPPDDGMHWPLSGPLKCGLSRVPSGTNVVVHVLSGPNTCIR